MSTVSVSVSHDYSKRQAMARLRCHIIDKLSKIIPGIGPITAEWNDNDVAAKKAHDYVATINLEQGGSKQTIGTLTVFSDRVAVFLGLKDEDPADAIRSDLREELSQLLTV